MTATAGHRFNGTSGTPATAARPRETKGAGDPSAGTSAVSDRSGAPVDGAEIAEANEASRSTAAPGVATRLESLIGDAVVGDPAARAALLTEIHPLVLRYCRARLGRQETPVGSADDVAQDVCLAVVSALPTYTVKGLSFRAFVYGIAAHKVTDAYRAIGRNRSEPVAEVPDAVVGDRGPENRVLSRELGEWVGELLHILTPRQREVIVLRLAVGLNAEETAEAVRSTPGAVRVTQHRALGRLREYLLDRQLARPATGEVTEGLEPVDSWVG